jgi:hypothetical protein
LDSRHLNAFQLVVSSEPSSTLIFLLHSFNPDFLFGFSPVNLIAAVDKVLEWLKVCHTAQFRTVNNVEFLLQRSRPPPTDLIQLWEDYRFMAHCEHIWDQDRGRENQVTEEDRGHCRQILSQVSPSLLRILQIIKFITYPAYHLYYPSQTLISKIHVLLDFSWDELRMAFCSLRSLILHEGEELIRIMPIVALDMVISPAHLLWDLTCGGLCVVRRILSGEVDKHFE